MYITNVTNDYNDTLTTIITNDSLSSTCTNIENNIEIVITLITNIPCGMSLVCLISLMVYTLIKPLFNNKQLMDKYLYPKHPVRCIITGPSECGKSVFLTTLILNIINEYDKIYIYSTSPHQDLYQKLIKCFSNYIPIHIIPNTLTEEDIDVVIDELVNIEDFEKSETEIETFDNIEEMKYPQEYENISIIILDDLNEKKSINDKIQAMFKRGRHNNLSIFTISQDYYEIPKRTISGNGNIYHIFKPNNFLDVRNIYQDKASMDMAPIEFKLLTSTCGNEIYQPLTIDMTKDKYTGRYRLGLNSIFVPISCPF